MSKLREQFERETGKIADNCTGLGDYSGMQADSDIDCEYIQWLESVVEKFTADNTQSTPCSHDTYNDITSKVHVCSKCHKVFWK